MVLLNFTQLLLLLLTLYLFHLGRGRTDAGNIGSFILEGRTFSVRSIITRLDANESYGKPKRIEESYSATQQRAKIEIHDEEGVEEFVYDAMKETRLSYNRVSEKCLIKNFDDLFDQFMLGASKIKRLLLSTRLNRYVVGPARLLFYLASRRDDMEIIPSSDVSSKVEIRNHKAAMLQLQMPELSNAVAIIFYDMATFTNKESCLSQIPLKVVIEIVEDKELIDLDFYDLRIGEVSSKATSFPNRDDDIRWDRFVSPLARGCSQLMPNSVKTDLMKLYFTGTQASFSAMSSTGNTYFVAIQGPLESIRIDTNIKDRSSTIKLIELRNNEKLTISKSQQQDDSPSGGMQCVATKAMVDERNRVKTDYRLSRTILGPEEFVYMGRSVVRGINALVYEAYPAPLPIWLSQPTIYRYKTTEQEKARERGERVQESNDKNEQDKYSMLVYLADEASDPGEEEWNRPLMIELYDMSGHQDDRRQLSIQIHNFMWELSEAPNGDKMHELFEYHESCLTRSATSRYAEVEFSLVGNLFEASWINELHNRQTAVAAAVREAFRTQSFMSYDLKSKVTSMQKDAESDSSLRVSFRVVERPQETYEFVFIGNAKLKLAWIDLTNQDVTVGAQDPGDCLQLVEPGQVTSYVLFSEREKTCAIDRKLIGDTDWNESQLFAHGTSYEGELYQVQIVQLDSDKPNKETLEAKVRRLENRLVSLRSPPLPKSGNMAIYNLPMRELKLKTVNYLQHVVADGNQLVGSIFQGFSLVETSSDQITRYEMAKQADDRLLSLDQCEAACLADLECKSFSYCSSWSEASCYLSKIPLNDAKVANQLNSAAKDQKPGEHLRVEVEGFGDIELKRDVRCELHNKLYLKLFHRSLPLTTTIDGAKVVGAADEEECAQKCFTSSLEAIGTNLARARKIEKITDQKDLESEIKNQPEKRASFVYGFCLKFLYFEGSLNENQSKLLGSFTEEANAYCIWLKGDFVEKTQIELPDELKKIELPLEIYRFDMSTLFERQSGLVMLDSGKTDRELEAYQNFKNHPNPEDYDVFRQAALEGRNFQKSYNYVGKEICAYRCFFQVYAPPPSCHSFDFIISKDYTPVCNLNSLSITSVARNLTRTVTSEKHRQAYHFEPRFGLIKDKTDLDSRTSYWLDIDNYKLTDDQVVWIKASVKWLLLAFAIFTGIVVGLKLTKKLDVRSRFNRQGSIGRLVVPDLTSRDDTNELAIW